MNSKQKGKRGEGELVKILNDNFGDGRFRRVPFSGAITGGVNRESNKNIDFKEALTADIITPVNFNFVIEHKFYAEANFWDLFSDKSNWNEWLKQVEGDAEFVDKTPLLVIKYNRHKRIALVPYSIIAVYADIKKSKEIEDMSKKFIWKEYSVIALEDLISLPKDFWFKLEQ